MKAREVIRDTVALESYAPVPSLGLLPVNAYLIRAEQPVLIDTSMAVVRDEFMDSLHAMIQPADLRWLWITHGDPEHIGSYQQVLNAAPDLQVVTNFVGVAKLSLMGLPVDRVYLINPGQTLDVGDRQLVCGRPPIFDAPETTSIKQPRSWTAKWAPISAQMLWARSCHSPLALQKIFRPRPCARA